MADSPSSDNLLFLNYDITSNGSKVSDALQVKSIVVKKHINKIPTAVISIFDWNQESLDFDVSNSDDFAPGAEIVINAGYDGDAAQIFSGVVIRHRLVATSDGNPVLEVECRDKALKMTIGRKNAYYAEKKDSDIISTLISNGGASADVEDTTVQHKELVQYYTTDWDFMMARAEANSQVVIVDDGKVTVQKPDVSSSAVLTCTYGTDIFSFEAELDAEHQLSAVQSTAWDMSSQANIQASGSNPSVNSQGNIDSSKLADVLGVSDFGVQSTGAVSQDDLTAWADAQMQKSWMSKVSGKASFRGSALAKHGAIIEFKGVGDRLSGDAYISGVEHEIKEGNWITTVNMGLSAEWFTEKVQIQAPNTMGLLGGVSGLMIGVVKQLDQDPDNEYRIQLTLPLMQDDDNGIWARMATFYATNSAGTFFIPEIGDEVVVGFLNGDPRYPIVLGSMYSSSNAAAYDLTADNYTKAFMTKALNKIEFDDEKKIITITTPGENQAIMNDDEKSITLQDQNSNSVVMNEDGISITDKSGNKIVMSSSGIEINSASDVTISASQNISGSATSNIDLSATNTFSASGMQIEHSADTSFTAKGNASAELSASGNTTIKGAMVMIN